MFHFKLFICLFCFASTFGVEALRLRRQSSSCGAREFQCKTGNQCIPAENICDGAVNCRDKSDETFALCTNSLYKCPNYAFRCAYGGCVDSDAVCNGVQDCADNSDELQPKCNGIKLSGDNKNCKPREFACVDGLQCVPAEALCDGAKDCKDGSDETISQCYNAKCPSYAFRCAYGGCIDGEYKCDGTVHCADRSDEKTAGCNTKIPDETTPRPTRPKPPPPSPSAGCLLPTPPASGSYYSINCDSSDSPACNNVPGTLVRNSWFLNFECNEGFHLVGSTFVECKNDQWTPNIPTCAAADRCTQIVSENDRFLLICRGPDSKTLPCNGPLPNGAIVKFRCNANTHYQVRKPDYKQVVCQNGRWDRELPDLTCTPVCGKPAPSNGAPYISNGTTTAIAEFPWNVGIYELDNNKWDQKCGGSLISRRIAVSAAHCFFDTSQGIGKGIRKPLSKIKVVAGKYFRAYDAPEDQFMQASEPYEIRIPEEYEGQTTSYEGDLAVIILKVQVTYNIAVIPVCLDEDRSKEDEFLQEGAAGKVVGWGITEHGKSSPTLLLATLPFVNKETCKRKVDITFQSYIISDKFCAGDSQSNVSVCAGDSGGGLSFLDEKSRQYYLEGIVSVGGRTCTEVPVALFTKVSRFMPLIEEARRTFSDP